MGTTHTDGRPLTVKDFGAKGDGVTDDTEAIQAMLTATGSVRFDTGDYVYKGLSLPASAHPQGGE